jgi:hypothetical protein
MQKLTNKQDLKNLEIRKQQLNLGDWGHTVWLIK